MRIRLFGKIIKVPKAVPVIAVILVIGGIVAAGFFTGRGKKLPNAEQLTASPGAAGEELRLSEGGNAAVDPGDTADKTFRTGTDTPVLPTPVRLVIHITGAVRREGVYWLEQGFIVQDAVEAAGGLLSGADTKSINLAMRLNDGMHIHIPYEYDEDKNWLPDSGHALSADGSSGQNGETRVNINTATLSELMTLNGIGESTAAEIIAYREEHGRFEKIEDIMNVPGIKEAKFNRIKKNITV
ncbi:MAG: helix-hairpin-helix domain-containing protein [Clostridia bacterium]|nr:helix-hairpin-helix domain-containing protein [Clostridia bacterium]